ncbi:hypothetical protein MMINT_00980 [Candidatus Methanomassiliicoccus intestinalis Issoire-Mx1]|uniref:Uncharacterized protein n=1 Tax=Methanomassiliicoccus intestinalis (strain Issoire-Mx1) TaxID=1295009 RepID=R9T834_METII|nr:hypothetical protein [Candidatus Methanomassiliicoccus intestinalis]AGN25508.1 hypothetical protein MMINT_00980 [Candidatus Methanomassiliicoccus intestinalis Issoire-Mx1]
MKTEKRLTMALSVLVALMMLAVPLASSSNLFVDGGQTNSNGDAPIVSDASNDDITIKDVYIIDNITDLNDLPIYDKLKSILGNKSDKDMNSYAPCLVTVYTVSDKVKSSNLATTGDLKVKFDVDYNNGTNDITKYGGYSGMNLYDSSKKEYYATFPLGTFNGDSDSLGISESKDYYNQVYTVSAQLYDSSSETVGSKVSMTSEVDNVTVDEVWMIDDQNSFEKIANYGKNLEDFIKGGKWTKINDATERDPWVAVAFTTTSPGTVTLNISAAHNLSSEKPFTMYWSKAGTYVFVATVSNQDGGTKDMLGMSNAAQWDNNIYNVEITAANGNKSVGSATYGSPSGTYNVIFKLNSDENSLDIPVVKIPTVSSSNTNVKSWEVNTDGDLVVSLTTEKNKVSIEYLITEIFDQITRNGYTLTEWASDDGNYTNMSYAGANNNKYTSSQYADGDKAVDKNMTFTATWELKEGFVEAPIHVYQDDVLVGDFIKAYEVRDKNTIFINPVGLAGDITKATGINTFGIIVNDATKPDVVNVKEVYSSKVTYGSSNDLPANGLIASNSEITVNYNLNDRLYSKVVVHSEAFKDGKDVTPFALKGADYKYSNVFAALQQKDDIHGIKAALALNDSGISEKDKNATTSDNYYLLTGWNNGAELLDSQRNAPAELTLDSELNGYYVIFMVNGQFEVVYVPYGELSADKCTIASNVKYWSYVTYDDNYAKDTLNNIQTFSFTKSQIKVIEGLTNDHKTPIAVFIGSEYSFNNTAYAVFDAGEGNFGNKYVDKMIVSGKASSGTTKTTISLPEVSPVYENTVVLVGYVGYKASGESASTFNGAGFVQTFYADVVPYKYTITFYNGSDVNGIFYYSGETTVDEKDITSNLVAFSYKGTAYDAADLKLNDSSLDITKAFNNVLYPAKDGYKVTQWKDTDGNVMLDKVKKETKVESDKNVTKITYEVKFKKISSDMSFYANFEAEKYAIIYSGNTATATNNMVQVGSVDEALTLFKDSTFSNDGYKLTGWNTRPDGDGTSYKLGDSFTLDGKQFKDLSDVSKVSNVPNDITKGFTLYAIWEKVGSSDNPSGNTDGNDSSDNTALYLIAGMLAVIAILAIVGIVLMRKKN